MTPDPANREKTPRWPAVAAGGAVSLVVGAVYLGTLAPTVLPYATPYTLDSPMLQAAVSVLGRGPGLRVRGGVLVAGRDRRGLHPQRPVRGRRSLLAPALARAPEGWDPAC